MRIVSLLILSLALPGAGLASPPTSPPIDFRASIDAEIPLLSLAQPAEVPADEGSLPWRVLGWANYAATGNIAVSQFYREDRAVGWGPKIDDVTSRLAVHGATVEAANEGSDLLRRRGNTARAWMVRVGYLAGAVFVAQDNYRSGWRRR